MSRILAVVAVAVVLLTGLTTSWAEEASASAGATIIMPLQLAKANNLEFGCIVPATTPQTVTLEANGYCEKTSNIHLVSTMPIPTGARFTMAGRPNAAFTIALPETSTVSRVGGGATAMTVTDFTSSPDSVGTMESDGTQSVTIGATVHVGASQPIGRYTGTFPVTISYN